MDSPKDNLEPEEKLFHLPQAKLSPWADFKIKSRLYIFIILKNTYKAFYLFLPKNQIFQKTLIGLLTVAIILAGTSVYAYSNGAITQGHMLYGLKRLVEKAETNLAISDAAKAKVNEKLFERRINEATRLTNQNSATNNKEVKTRNSEYIQKNIDEALLNISSAVNAARKMPASNEAQTVKNNLKNAGDEALNNLEKIETEARDHDSEVEQKAGQAQEEINTYHTELDSESQDFQINNQQTENNGSDTSSYDENKRTTPEQNYERNYTPQNTSENSTVNNQESSTQTSGGSRQTNERDGHSD